MPIRSVVLYWVFVRGIYALGELHGWVYEERAKNLINMVYKCVAEMQREQSKT